MKQRVSRPSWKSTLKILGVLVCLAGALLMWDGHLLGERTIGIATVVGITGIGIISTSGRILP